MKPTGKGLSVSNQRFRTHHRDKQNEVLYNPLDPRCNEISKKIGTGRMQQKHTSASCAAGRPIFQSMTSTTVDMWLLPGLNIPRVNQVLALRDPGLLWKFLEMAGFMMLIHIKCWLRNFWTLTIWPLNPRFVSESLYAVVCVNCLLLIVIVINSIYFFHYANTCLPISLDDPVKAATHDQKTIGQRYPAWQEKTQ